MKMTIKLSNDAVEKEDRDKAPLFGRGRKRRKGGAYVIIGGYKWRIRSVGELAEITERRLRELAHGGTVQPMAKNIEEKRFADGSLVRGMIEKKIFVIENGFRKNVYLERLENFFGHRVWTLDDEELQRIPVWPEMADGQVN